MHPACWLREQPPEWSPVPGREPSDHRSGPSCWTAQRNNVPSVPANRATTAVSSLDVTSSPGHRWVLCAPCYPQHLLYSNPEKILLGELRPRGGLPRKESVTVKQEFSFQMPDPQVSGSPAREQRPTTNPRVSRAAPAHRGPIPDATPLTQPRGEARGRNRQENTEKGKPGGGLALVAVSTPCTPATVLTVGLARGHANGSAAGAGSPAQAPTRMHTEPGTQVAAQVAGLEEPAFQSGCGRHPRCNANTNS